MTASDRITSTGWRHRNLRVRRLPRSLSLTAGPQVQRMNVAIGPKAAGREPMDRCQSDTLARFQWRENKLAKVQRRAARRSDGAKLQSMQRTLRSRHVRRVPLPTPCDPLHGSNFLQSVASRFAAHPKSLRISIAAAHAFVQTRLPHHSQCPPRRRADRLYGTVRLRRRRRRRWRG